MNLDANTMIRVQAKETGVYNGVDGDIIVCDPAGSDPLARFPRIKAKDARPGVMAGLILVDVDEKAFHKSEKTGDTNANEVAKKNAMFDEKDLSGLARLEARMNGDVLMTDNIARAPEEGDVVVIENPIVEDGNAKSEDGVSSKHIAGGNFEVFAPWLAEPNKVKGKEAAAAEVQRLRDEGPPANE